MHTIDSLQLDIDSQLSPGYSSVVKLLKIKDMWVMGVFIVFAGEARLYLTQSYVGKRQALNDIPYIKENFLLKHHRLLKEDNMTDSVKKPYRASCNRCKHNTGDITPNGYQRCYSRSIKNPPDCDRYELLTPPPGYIGIAKGTAAPKKTCGNCVVGEYVADRMAFSCGYILATHGVDFIVPDCFNEISCEHHEPKTREHGFKEVKLYIKRYRDGKPPRMYTKDGDRYIPLATEPSND